jgi:hypothetical protein
MRALVALVFCLALSAPLGAQKEKREPLTEAQQDQIAEYGIDPVARVNLYVKFLNEYADNIRVLIKHSQSAGPARRLDELGDNLDTYSDRKADIRMSLKGLNEGIARWQGVLHDLPSQPAFELALKEALDSAGDLADQARQLSADQEAYFKAHPDEKGQDRYEPK